MLYTYEINKKQKKNKSLIILKCNYCMFKNFKCIIINKVPYSKI